MRGALLVRSMGALVFLAVSLSAAADEPQRQRIGVLEFTAKGGVTQEQLDVLADVAANELRANDRFEVVTKTDIQAMLGLERAKALVGCDDASCIAEIGGALGVDLIVAGNAGQFGRFMALNLKLIDIRRATVRNSVAHKLEGGVESLLEDTPDAVRELLGLAPRYPSAPSPPSGSPFRAFPAPSTPAAAQQRAENNLRQLGFGPQQVADLRLQKIELDTDALDAIANLVRRGFSPGEVMHFIEERRLLEQPPGRRIDWFLYQLTGWEKKYWTEFLRSKKPFSDFYNDYAESAPLEVFKWLLLGFSLLLVGEGALIASLAMFDEDSEDRQEMTPAQLAAEKETQRHVGYGLIGGGSGCFLVFGILLIVDLQDRGHVPPGFFETATREQILETMPAAEERLGPRLRVTASPWIHRDGSAGLALGLSF